MNFLVAEMNVCLLTNTELSQILNIIHYQFTYITHIYNDVYSFLYTHVLSHFSCLEDGCFFLQNTDNLLPVDSFPL